LIIQPCSDVFNIQLSVIAANDNKSVIVIGAGIAGVSAAVKLIENGFGDVTVLEATDRIGGRVHTVQFGSENSTIDLGGQWVSAINEVYELVKDHFEFGQTNYSEDRTVFMSTDEEELDQEKCRRLAKLGHGILELTEEMTNSEETFGEFFTRKFLNETEKMKDIDEKLVNQMLRYHEGEFNSQYASTSWHQLKVKFFAEDDLGMLDYTWKTSGYSTLFDFVTVSQIETIKLSFLAKPPTEKAP
jgi:spermine oxidase